MSKHIYANLAPMGWTDLTTDPNCVVSIDRMDPITWYKSNGILDSIEMNTIPGYLTDYPFVHVLFENKEYRVSPLSFQIMDD